MQFRVFLEARTPLAISRQKATGNQLRTVWRIPGATWRGAVAAHLMGLRKLTENAHEDGEFHSLFLSGEVRFGDLRPAGRRLWPLSARGCSRDADHPVFDLLINTALSGKLPERCTSCGSKVVLPPEGYYAREGGTGHPKPERVIRRTVAHTAISGRTLRVREEQFFSTEILERGQRFEGNLWCSDRTTPFITAAVGKGLEVAVGRGGTRGQGHAKIEVEASDTPAVPERRLIERLEALNACVPPEFAVFSCGLESPCVVYDELLLSRSWVEPGDIAQAAGIPISELDDYELLASYSRMAPQSGWNAQSKLPKSDVWSIEPGSAFLFARRIDPALRLAELARLAPILAKATEGIGERWEEGFGEAVFCDEFHVKQRPQ